MHYCNKEMLPHLLDSQSKCKLGHQVCPETMLNLWFAILHQSIIDGRKRGNESSLGWFRQQMLPKPGQVLTSTGARSNTSQQRLLPDDIKRFLKEGWLQRKMKKENREQKIHYLRFIWKEKRQAVTCGPQGTEAKAASFAVLRKKIPVCWYHSRGFSERTWEHCLLVHALSA